MGKDVSAHICKFQLWNYIVGFGEIWYYKSPLKVVSLFSFWSLSVHYNPYCMWSSKWTWSVFIHFLEQNVHDM